MTLLLAPSRTGLSALRDRLLVQCGPDDLDGTLPLLRPGAGVVVTGLAACDAARCTRRRWLGPLLADRARYVGAARTLACAPLSRAWIDAQRDAHVTVPLTDSGYVGPSDEAGLVNVLTSAAGLGGDVVAVLPVHRRWLSHDVELLNRHVNAHGVPVALVIEHSGDPCGTRAVVAGLTRFLTSTTAPVLLLRSDLSALVSRY